MGVILSQEGNSVNIDSCKTLFIIDGSSFLYRAYYGTRPLHTLEGVPVNAIYSFCRTVKKLIEKFHPEHMVLVWDSKGKTVRHEMYHEYKATRQEPPSDLFTQKEKIVEFANLIGLAQVAQVGIEADDLMYSLARKWTSTGGTAVLITSDKDMGQALDEHTLLYDAFKEKMVDLAEFEQTMGFSAKKLPFYFGLLGDTSDNIPGVKGIGKVTVQELVTTYSSLEDLYAHIDQVKPPRAQTALREQKENAFLSEQLFTLQLPKVDVTLDQLAFSQHNWSKARPLFQELQFKSLLTEIGAAEPEARKKGTGEEKIARLRTYNFVTVTTAEQLQDLVALMNARQEYAVDTETNGLAPLQCKLVGISISCDGNQAFYIPIAHATGEQQLSPEYVLTTLKPLFENPKHKKYFHSAKFDQLVLFSHGIDIKGLAFDTLIAGSLVTKDWQRIGLKEVSSYYLQEAMLTFQEVVTERKYKNFTQVPLELATLYAANDALQTWRLVDVFRKELAKEHMEALFYDLEMPIAPILFDMEKEVFCWIKRFLKI